MLSNDLTLLKVETPFFLPIVLSFWYKILKIHSYFLSNVSYDSYWLFYPKFVNNKRIKCRRKAHECHVACKTAPNLCHFFLLFSAKRFVLYVNIPHKVDSLIMPLILKSSEVEEIIDKIDFKNHCPMPLWFLLYIPRSHWVPLSQSIVFCLNWSYLSPIKCLIWQTTKAKLGI